jgi:lipopolysaccharide/colanic/teichoic acid biosynthesis glycosyltransferase
MLVSIPPPSGTQGLGGAIAPSALKRSQGEGTLLGEILVRNGDAKLAMIEQALQLQEERGGQLGRILVSIGASSEIAIARALVDQIKMRSKGRSADASAAARANPEVAGLKVLTRPALTTLALFLVDVFSFGTAALLAFFVDRLWSGYWHWDEWWVLTPAILLSLTVFLFLDLYSPLAKSTPDELRITTIATSMIQLSIAAMAMPRILLISQWGILARATWLIATCVLVPVLRATMRGRLSPLPWWGLPVIILGAAKTGRLVVRTLKAQPRSGLKPVALLDDDPQKHGTLRASFTNEVVDLRSISIAATNFMSESTRKMLADELLGPDSDALSGTSSRPPPPTSNPPLPPDDTFLGPESTRISIAGSSDRPSTFFPRGKFAEVEGVPLLGDLALAPVLAQKLKVPYAVVAMPGVDSYKLLEITERVGSHFSHLLVIPDLFGFATLGVPAKSIGGILGVEVRQQLLLPWPKVLKRAIDLTLTVFGGIFILPFLMLIAILIKLDSKGPVFYFQPRLGRDGQYFPAAKFRTMHGDGEARLKAILDADPALRAEYEVYHKLRKDPRVTRIGRILRKFSLDEFPQLLSVLKGDMSLVGPRPYIERELPDMNGQEKIILRATPGMTGMWQVSDRNAASFAWRVQVDVHYVRNWSPWLDMYILAKTIGVVLKGSGV